MPPLNASAPSIPLIRAAVESVERSDTHHVVASPCWHARMTDYLRNSAAGCGFFFERLQDVQQGDGFRKGSTHPTGYVLIPRAACILVFMGPGSAEQH